MSLGRGVKAGSLTSGNALSAGDKGKKAGCVAAASVGCAAGDDCEIEFIASKAAVAALAAAFAALAAAFAAFAADCAALAAFVSTPEGLVFCSSVLFIFVSAPSTMGAMVKYTATATGKNISLLNREITILLLKFTKLNATLL